MGKLQKHEMLIPYLHKERTVRIYLPAAYDKRPAARFPVLYMQDGQALFGDDPQFAQRSWQLKKTLDALEETEGTQDVIVVGIDSDPARRPEDYSPWQCSPQAEALLGQTARGGEGGLYADFFVNVLKPWVDARYRTKPGADNTAVAGSSLGALISVYLKLAYPGVFAKVGALSLASWFAEEELLRFLREKTPGPADRYYLQMGAKEDSGQQCACMPQLYLDCAVHFYQALLEKTPVGQTKLVLGAQDEHNVESWARHMAEMLRFLFPGPKEG